MKQLLHNKTFLQLWVGQIISDLGVWICYVGLSAWFLAQFGSASQFAFFTGSRILIGFLAAPFAGHIADKYSKRTLMILSNLMRALILPSFLIIQNLVIVYAVALILTFFEKVFDAAYGSYFPRVIDKDALLKANSARRMTSAMTAIIGPGVGGLILALTKYDVVFIINAVSLLATVFIFMFCKEISSDKSQKSASFIVDLTNSFKFIITGTGLLYFTLIRLIDGLGSGAYNAALPLLGKSYSVDGKFIGFLLAAWGAGTFIGSLITTRFKKQVQHYGKIYVFAVILMAVFVGAAYIVPGKYFALAMIFIGGIGDGITGVVFSTYIMQNTPNNILGKVYSMTNSTVMACVSLGMFFTSAGFSYASFSTIAQIASGIIILGSLAVYFVLGKKVVREQSLSA